MCFTSVIYLLFLKVVSLKIKERVVSAQKQLSCVTTLKWKFKNSPWKILEISEGAAGLEEVGDAGGELQTAAPSEPALLFGLIGGRVTEACHSAWGGRPGPRRADSRFGILPSSGRGPSRSRSSEWFWKHVFTL